jgi:hypothetical protein
MKYAIAAAAILGTALLPASSYASRVYIGTVITRDYTPRQTHIPNEPRRVPREESAIRCRSILEDLAAPDGSSGLDGEFQG